jgi:hypothetical protein
MSGLDVAPVAPQPRLRATSLGSTVSSHTFVPEAISDCKGVVISNLALHVPVLSPYSGAATTGRRKRTGL